jgi:hypothetical protein
MILDSHVPPPLEEKLKNELKQMVQSMER